MPSPFQIKRRGPVEEAINVSTARGRPTLASSKAQETPPDRISITPKSKRAPVIERNILPVGLPSVGPQIVPIEAPELPTEGTPDGKKPLKKNKKKTSKRTPKQTEVRPEESVEASRLASPPDPSAQDSGSKEFGLNPDKIATLKANLAILKAMLERVDMSTILALLEKMYSILPKDIESS